MSSKVGRPSKYKPEICQEMIDYFSIPPYREVTKTIRPKNGDPYEVETIEANDFPSFAGFAAKIGVHRETLHEWKRSHALFSDAYKMCKELQENFVLVNGFKGTVNTTFAIFTSKNLLSYRDRFSVEHEGNPEKPIEVKSVPLKERLAQLKASSAIIDVEKIEEKKEKAKK